MSTFSCTDSSSPSLPFMDESWGSTFHCSGCRSTHAVTRADLRARYDNDCSSAFVEHTCPHCGAVGEFIRERMTPGRYLRDIRFEGLRTNVADVYRLAERQAPLLHLRRNSAAIRRITQPIGFVGYAIAGIAWGSAVCGTPVFPFGVSLVLTVFMVPFLVLSLVNWTFDTYPFDIPKRD